jgi:hypothetical protein
VEGKNGDANPTNRRHTRGGGGWTRGVGGRRAGSGEKKVDHVYVSTSFFLGVDLFRSRD